MHVYSLLVWGDDQAACLYNNWLLEDDLAVYIYTPLVWGDAHAAYLYNPWVLGDDQAVCMYTPWVWGMIRQYVYILPGCGQMIRKNVSILPGCGGMIRQHVCILSGCGGMIRQPVVTSPSPLPCHLVAPALTTNHVTLPRCKTASLPPSSSSPYSLH